MNFKNRIKTLLTQLVGSEPPIPNPQNLDSCQNIFNSNGIGYSQFNELMLLFGLDRISIDFFQYIANKKLHNIPNDPPLIIESIDDLEEGINKFRVFAIFRFGNIRYAFKTLSKIGEEESFNNWLETLKPKGKEYYQNRHSQILSIKKIPYEDTYYNGEFVGRQIEQDLTNNPNDMDLLQKKAKMDEVRKKGIFNYQCYLASDHLDVYIATSMRQRHEYIFVNKIIDEIFSDSQINLLGLRKFNPTLAFCKNRIDKGLLEGLMLKRAKCTIYLAQETDTFGKDSELASTLAQGKPVIAFVPEGSKSEVDTLIDNLKKIHKNKKTEFEIILDQLMIFKPDLPWKDRNFRLILDNPIKENLKKLKDILYKEVKNHYDDRFNKLCNHPLGIQVNIETGVANGVFVVRSVKKCAKLLYALLTGEGLVFNIKTKAEKKGDYLLLTEQISNSIFRVVTNDTMLTNTFWNYYTKS